MRIWLFKISEPLPVDASINRGRTAMLGAELASRGHDVLWWISSFDHQRKRMVLPDDAELQLAPHLTARALRGIPYRKNLSVRRYVDHQLIAWKFRSRARALPRPDAIVASMPDHLLTFEAVMLARRLGVPILVDIRDPWPDVFLDHWPPPARPVLKAMLARDYWILRKTLTCADGITSMVSDWLDWGLAKVGRAPTWKDKVFFIGGPRQLVDPPIPDRIRPLVERVQGSFVVTFVGTFNRNYQPKVVVEAVEHLRARGTSLGRIDFILAGDGEFFDSVRELAQGLDNVHFPGWVNRDEIEAIQSVSSVGVVPALLPTPAFPNKAFGYLSAGLPVLSSNDGDMRRLLLSYDAGFHFERGDSRKLADQIELLAGQPDVCRRMAHNARRLFGELLDAERIYSSFADHVEAVAGDWQERAQDRLAGINERGG